MHDTVRQAAFNELRKHLDESRIIIDEEQLLPHVMNSVVVL